MLNIIFAHQGAAINMRSIKSLWMRLVLDAGLPNPHFACNWADFKLLWAAAG